MYYPSSQRKKLTKQNNLFQNQISNKEKTNVTLSTKTWVIRREERDTITWREESGFNGWRSCVPELHCFEMPTPKLWLKVRLADSEEKNPHKCLRQTAELKRAWIWNKTVGPDSWACFDYAITWWDREKKSDSNNEEEERRCWEWIPPGQMRKKKSFLDQARVGLVL